MINPLQVNVFLAKTEISRLWQKKKMEKQEHLCVCFLSIVFNSHCVPYCMTHGMPRYTTLPLKQQNSGVSFSIHSNFSDLTRQEFVEIREFKKLSRSSWHKLT